ncbi:MAG: alpha-ribazole phosphatase [Cyclobacteriaceae bacterium]|nr:alpha-ribazole phosphatase [Cyclobacteriaceae bacterium]
MLITLVRHTRVQIESHVLYGHTDVPLASTWQGDFNEVLSKVNTDSQVVIYCSPLSRCVKLAERLSEKLSAKIIKEDRIKELNYGEWEEKHLNTLPQDQLVRWKSNFVNQSCPGGETFRQLLIRSLASIDDIKQTPHKEVIVVTHSGVIRALLAHYLRIPLEYIFSFDIAFGSISQILLKEDGTSLVKCVNL